MPPTVQVCGQVCVQGNALSVPENVDAKGVRCYLLYRLKMGKHGYPSPLFLMLYGIKVRKKNVIVKGICEIYDGDSASRRPNHKV